MGSRFRIGLAFLCLVLSSHLVIAEDITIDTKTDERDAEKDTPRNAENDVTVKEEEKPIENVVNNYGDGGGGGDRDDERRIDDQSGGPNQDVYFETLLNNNPNKYFQFFQSSRSYGANPFNTTNTVHYTNPMPNYVQPVYYHRYHIPGYMQYMDNNWKQHDYNYRQPVTGYVPNYSNGYSSAARLSNRTILRSPYQTLPGTYKRHSYNTQLYFSGQPYRAEDIYASYLASGAYQYHSGRCANHYGQTPMITMNDMQSAFDYANHLLRTDGQTYGNYSLYPSHSPPLMLKEKEAALMEYVTQYFAKFKCLSKYQMTSFLPTVSIGDQYIRSNRYGDASCYSSYGSRQGWTLQCRDAVHSKYRSIDGSCNNLQHPYWGKSYTCHIRLLPPDYADGVSAPRMAHDGSPLPNSRTLSNILTSDKSFESFYTHMKMAFGQFANHDITNTPVHGSYALSASYSSPVDCCRGRAHSQCYPIYIAKTPNDYLYRKYNNTCMNFIRSAPCPLCELGPRQQLNTATSFIDAGTLYGNTVDEAKALRSFRFGLMKTSRDFHGRPILPATPTPFQHECSPPNATMPCFVAGDMRCNQHPSLMCMHLIFLRRHNQHATALRLVNPHWNDEKLYQEARRLLVAEFQHITYNEYLPIVFGGTLMNYYSLNVSPRGYTLYEPHTDPSSWNDYATVACRFGHSQIRGFSTVVSNRGTYNSSDNYWLRDRFLDPSYMLEGKMDGILKGLLTDYSYSVDPYYAHDIKNYLLRKKGDLYGSDLIARNIHRGKDHGIASYVHYLKYCFGFQARSWDDLRLFIPDHMVNLFRQLYKSYIDVDFYIAGISERHFPDADVGPTFACVLGIQYYHLKFGDRYYYEHGGQAGSFSPAQLDNIRGTTSLSRLICRTGDYITAAQRYAFFPVSNFNKLVSCKQLPEINYRLWRDGPQRPH